MVIEVVLAATAVFAQAWKASDLDEKALKTLQRAHYTHANAIALFQRKKEVADQSLVKLINRKRAILSSRIPRFISVYEQIQAIDFQPGEGIVELYSNSFPTEAMDEIKEMSITSLTPMSEKELVTTYLLKGVGGMLLADAKRNVSIANSQEQIADTLYSQTETLVVALDAIGQRAEQIAQLLSHLSLHFGQCIDSTEQIIQHNGLTHTQYSKADRDVLMNCVNFATAIKKILDVPILNGDGSVTKESLNALKEGSARLKELQRCIGGAT